MITSETQLNKAIICFKTLPSKASQECNYTRRRQGSPFLFCTICAPTTNGRSKSARWRHRTIRWRPPSANHRRPLMLEQPIAWAIERVPVRALEQTDTLDTKDEGEEDEEEEEGGLHVIGIISVVCVLVGGQTSPAYHHHLQLIRSKQLCRVYKQPSLMRRRRRWRRSCWAVNHSSSNNHMNHSNSMISEMCHGHRKQEIHRHRRRRHRHRRVRRHEALMRVSWGMEVV